jgi:hypothetical protein
LNMPTTPSSMMGPPWLPPPLWVTGAGRPVPGVSVSRGRAGAAEGPPEPMLPDGNNRFGVDGGEDESGSMWEDSRGCEVEFILQEADAVVGCESESG